MSKTTTVLPDLSFEKQVERKKEKQQFLALISVYDK